MRVALQTHLSPVVRSFGIDPLTVIALVNVLISAWKACQDDNAQDMAHRLQHPGPLERRAISKKCRRYLLANRGNISDRHALTAAVLEFFAAQDRQELAATLRACKESEDDV